MEKFFNVIESVNNAEVSAQQKVAEVATGKSDDTAGALVAEDKVAFQMEFMATVREKGASVINKLMDTQI